MQSTLDKIFGLVLIVVLIMIGISAAGRIRQSETVATPTDGPSSEARHVGFWREGITAGFHIGGAVDAPVTLLVLADLQCPACRSFHLTIQEFLKETGSSARVIHVPHPLAYFSSSFAAAEVSVCAAEAGVLAPFLDAVYMKQDSLGVKPWASFADDAGVPHLAERIEACAMAEDPTVPIIAGLSFGAKIGLDAIPAVLIDGWLLSAPPTLEELRAGVAAVRAGRAPQNPRNIRYEASS